MQPAIRVENLSKRYGLFHDGERRHTAYRTLRDELMRLLKTPLRYLSGDSSGKSEDFWALMSVNFEVEPGEALGIIGRNGAGKSTLLKILSRITKPTMGQVEIRGRVSSLLEVGTGFHPELTGRENIYLNGSILGMTHREINRTFDEIVAFSGVEPFIDTPVKRYSSGMQVRLAFAVAAHLSPEILIVDEVLAVGDHEFQKKCLGKMGEVANSGRTVLFVSHNMDAIARLTKRCLLFSKGVIEADGRPLDVIRSYMAGVGTHQSAQWRQTAPDPEKQLALTAVSIYSARGELSSHLNADESFQIQIAFRVSKPIFAQIAFRLSSNDGQVVFTSGHADSQRKKCTHFSRGDYGLRCLVPAHLLCPGVITFWLRLTVPRGGNSISSIKPPLSRSRRLARL